MVDLERYVTFRKLIADIVWYRKTRRIDELSVQVAQHSDMDIFLHCGDDKAVIEKINADRRNSSIELANNPDCILYVMDCRDVRIKTSISNETLKTLKIWSDACFYRDRPRAFEMLMSSTFNAGTIIKYDPLELNSNDISDEDSERGNTVRRMLCYHMIGLWNQKGDSIFIDSPTFDIAYLCKALKRGLVEKELALLAYDIIKNYNLKISFETGEIENPFKWENDIYKYYYGHEFDEKLIGNNEAGKISLIEKPEDNCLATQMSKLSYTGDSIPWETRFKKEFLRKLFDDVIKTGEIPSEVFLDISNCSVELKEFVQMHGTSELIQTLDAAFFMISNPKIYDSFKTVQCFCDCYESNS